MTKLAPEWVRTNDPVIRSPARYRTHYSKATSLEEVIKLNEMSDTCVTIEGFVLYAGGDYALHLDIMLLV